MTLITTLLQFVRMMNRHHEWLKTHIPNSSDVWYEPHEKWFIFKAKGEVKFRKQKLEKLKSTMVDIPQILEHFKEYDRLQQKKMRRQKQMQSIILTADKEYALVQVRPFYLKGKKLKNAEHQLLKAEKYCTTKKMSGEESYCQKTGTMPFVRRRYMMALHLPISACFAKIYSHTIHSIT